MVLALCAAFAFVTWLGPLGASATIWVDQAGVVSAAWFGAIMCLRAARRQTGRARAAWALMASGAVSYALGETTWTLFDRILGIEPFPSVADVFYLAGIPLIGAALLRMPSTPNGVLVRWRTALDGILIAVSVLVIWWVLVLSKIMPDTSDALLSDVISLAYPAGDVAQISILLFITGKGFSLRRGMGSRLATGLTAIALTDSIFAYLVATSGFDNGVIDTGWVCGYLMIGTAAMAARPAVGEDPARRVILPGVLIPFATATVSLAVSAIAEIQGQDDLFIFWSSAAIVTVVLVRLGVTILENHSLTRNLETKIDERTAELRAREHRFSSLIQNASDVITVVARDGTIAYQSDSIATVFGHRADEVLGANLISLLHPDDSSRVLALIDRLADRSQGSHTSAEFRMRRRSGAWRDVECQMTNLASDPHVAGIVLNSRDVTERRDLERELAHQAFHDNLTGLANRTLLRERLEHELAKGNAERIAIVFLDLDGFKSVNDTFGHAFGDRLLAQVAQRLQARTRPSDTVARLGGDEFAVLLEDLRDESEAVSLAERLLQAFTDRFHVEGKEVHAHASAGIALGAGTAGDLMRNADLAMYLAKAKGGGCQVFDPSMHEALRARVELERDLRGAVERGEFVLHYQPVVALDTGEVVGAEALCRWNHPVRGQVPPVEFIRVAEDTGQIVEIGAWVVREASAQIIRWRQEFGKDLWVSVNVSPRQLQTPRLEEQLSSAIEDGGAPPGSITLEITESMLLADGEATLEQLHAFKRAGVRLAIDDFGTGFSSLSYLQRVPADVLKIDRAFVARVDRGPEESAVARAVIELARSFKMRVVAEGIERGEQAEVLAAMGCDAGQGFHFATPLTAAEFAAFVERPAALAPAV